MKLFQHLRCIRQFSLAAGLGLISLVSHAQTNHNIGTGTTGNIDDEYPTPFGDYYESPRQQFLYTAAEATAAGMTAGNITGIKWTVTNLNASGIHEQFTIKIGTTSTGSLSLTGWEPLSTIVYGPLSYQPVMGVNTFTFSTPFAWNGTSNIVVEVCGGDPSNTTGPDQYTWNATVPYHTVTFNGSRTLAFDDFGNVCSLNDPDNWDQQEWLRPNITFVMSGTSAPCLPPTGVAMSSITNNSATAAWMAPAGVTNFEYIVDQVAASPTASGTPITGNSLPIGSLAPGTGYHFHIRSACTGSTFSSWVNIPFTTTATPGCNPPDSITVSSITPTSATLSWGAVTGATGYEYAVLTSATPPAVGVTITNLIVTKPGLVAGTTYYAHVKTKCGSTTSTWRTRTFTTLPTGIAQVEAQGDMISVSPNPTSGAINLVKSDNKAGRVIISDVSGRIMKELQVCEEKTHVDLSDVATGLYFIHYSNGEKSEVIKLQKL
jgi:hypothetical protein